MSPLWTLLRGSEYLRTVFGHENRVLELGRKGAVAGANRPAVSLVRYGVASAHVDHGFDRETDAGREAILPSLTGGEMGNGWLLMKLAAHAMPHELADDAEASLGGFAHNRVADVRDTTVGLDGIDCRVEAVECTLGDGSGFVGHCPDKKRLRGIAVPTIDDRRQIQIHDVPFLEDVISRDSVADDLIQACTAALWVAMVAQRGWPVPVADGVFSDEPIDLARRDSRADMGADKVHQLRVETTSCAHGLALGLGELQFSL